MEKQQFITKWEDEMEDFAISWDFPAIFEVHGMLFNRCVRGRDFYPTTTHGPIRLPPGRYQFQPPLDCSDEWGSIGLWARIKLPRNIRALLKEHRLLTQKVQNLLPKKRMLWFVKCTRSVMLADPENTQLGDVLRNFPVFSVVAKDFKSNPRRNVLYRDTRLELPSSNVVVSREPIVVFDENHQPHKMLQVFEVKPRFVGSLRPNLTRVHDGLKRNDCWVVESQYVVIVEEQRLLSKP